MTRLSECKAGQSRTCSWHADCSRMRFGRIASCSALEWRLDTAETVREQSGAVCCRESYAPELGGSRHIDWITVYAMGYILDCTFEFSGAILGPLGSPSSSNRELLPFDGMPWSSCLRALLSFCVAPLMPTRGFSN